MTANHHQLNCISCDSKDTDVPNKFLKKDTITTWRKKSSLD